MNNQMSSSKKSVALDSNVWRYLIDADAIGDVRKAAKAAQTAIVILPAVLYETLRMGDGPTKDQLLEVQTRQVWSRAMPEAFSEAEEIRVAIARLRPEWLMEHPDLRTWRLFEKDWRSNWKTGTWSRARHEPAQMAVQIGDGGIPTARDEARAARAIAMRLGLTFADLNPGTFESWFEGPVSGWDGEHFETWRAEALNAWLPVVAGMQSGAYADWLVPWIIPGLLRTHWSSWIRFWTRDVSAQLLPRQWMRTSMRIAASTRKTSPGAPVDVQLSTYLHDVDAFCTSDSVFVDCIEKLRPDAPLRFSDVYLLRARDAAVDDLLAVIAEQVTPKVAMRV